MLPTLATHSGSSAWPWQLPDPFGAPLSAPLGTLRKQVGVPVRVSRTRWGIEFPRSFFDLSGFARVHQLYAAPSQGCVSLRSRNQECASTFFIYFLYFIYFTIQNGLEAGAKCCLQTTWQIPRLPYNMERKGFKDAHEYSIDKIEINNKTEKYRQTYIAI